MTSYYISIHNDGEYVNGNVNVNLFEFSSNRVKLPLSADVDDLVFLESDMEVVASGVPVDPDFLIRGRVPRVAGGGGGDHPIRFPQGLKVILHRAYPGHPVVRQVGGVIFSGIRSNEIQSLTGDFAP